MTTTPVLPELPTDDNIKRAQACGAVLTKTAFNHDFEQGKIMNQNPVTTFANNANPFAHLVKPAKPKRVNAHSAPKPSASHKATAVPPSKKPISFVTVDEMSITNDALPASRTLPVNKYLGIFSAMKPGQCVRCLTSSVPKVSHSLRKFVSTQKLRVQVKSVLRYEGDPGYGRVWILPEQDSNVTQLIQDSK